MRRVLVVWMMCLPVCAPAWAQVYEAPSPEPTVEETLILEYINRARADPAAEAQRIRAGGVRVPGDVDLDMFAREMQALKPAPPLVFNLQLLDAARKHAHYMVLNEQGHSQTPGKPGFTGKSMGQRIKAAGYRGSSMAENAFRTANDAWHSHAAFEIDWGPGGPGGMQDGRGHRTNIHNAGYREIGPAAVPHGRQFSVVHNFGSRSGRFAGGVVYFDKNNNGVYDAGEGQGGVTIRAGDQSVKSWASGAYALQIPADKAVTLTAGYDDLAYSHAYPASGDNVKFDFVIPARHDIDKAKRLIAAAEAIDVREGDERAAAAKRRAVLGLYFDTQSLYLDDATRQRVVALTGDVVAELDALKAGITEQLATGDAVEARRAIFAARAEYRGTPVDDWLADAYACAALLPRQQQLAQTAQSDRGVTASQVKAVVGELERKRKSMKTDHWRGWLEALIADTRGLAPEA